MSNEVADDDKLDNESKVEERPFTYGNIDITKITSDKRKLRIYLGLFPQNYPQIPLSHT